MHFFDIRGLFALFGGSTVIATTKKMDGEKDAADAIPLAGRKTNEILSLPKFPPTDLNKSTFAHIKTARVDASPSFTQTLIYETRYCAPFLVCTQFFLIVSFFPFLFLSSSSPLPHAPFFFFTYRTQRTLFRCDTICHEMIP